MADNFASRSEVKQYLGIASSNTTDDSLLDALLLRTTKMIQAYTGRTLLQATYTDEKYDGDGERELLLTEYPLITLTSVYDSADRDFGDEDLLVEDDGITNEGNYVIVRKGFVENPGIIRRIDGVWSKGDQNIKVTYVAGYSDANIPKDLVQAQIDWLSYIYRNKDARIGIDSYRLGQYSVTYRNNSASAAQGNSVGGVLPPDEVRMVLDNYKDPRIGSTAA